MSFSAFHRRLSEYIDIDIRRYSRSRSLYNQRPQVYRNNFSTSSEFDRLESDRDGIDRFRGKTDETKALDRERARCSMASWQSML